MENRRIARFFIETLIDEQVDEIAVIPQEYTYKKIQTKKKKVEDKETEVKEEVFSIIRFDFVATIRTAQGEYKKVLIEIQKSQKPTDLIRFRTYLGEQYKQTDMVEVKSGKVVKALPIICIYLLGFTLPQISAKAIKVNRTYTDIIKKKRIMQKSDFIEALTHDGYFVQIPHIKGKPGSHLEKLLSIFEQGYFVDEKNIVKSYEHPVDNEIIREMIDILRHVAADPKERRSLEAEWLAMKDEEEYERMRETIAENKKTIAKMDETIAENNKTIAKKDDTIAKKDDTIDKLEDENAKLRSQLAQLQAKAE
jgi:uncharacterized coiled-coil protein SlyX